MTALSFQVLHLPVVTVFNNFGYLVHETSIKIQQI